jgi:cellulose synthase/poly-beta-1,6-N-acetylglucosamine synthase-like glycosyltransferase
MRGAPPKVVGYLLMRVAPQKVIGYLSSMKLSLVVPVYNEAQHLREVVPFLYSTKLPIDCEWIFIDDKSTDGSAEILKELAKT